MCIRDRVTRENIPVKGSIEFLKVDAETKQPLAGVVYYLFDAEGNKVADGTTDATGKVTFSGLRLGKYLSLIHIFRCALLYLEQR